MSIVASVVHRLPAGVGARVDKLSILGDEPLRNFGVPFLTGGMD